MSFERQLKSFSEPNLFDAREFVLLNDVHGTAIGPPTRHQPRGDSYDPHTATCDGQSTLPHLSILLF